MAMRKRSLWAAIVLIVCLICAFSGCAMGKYIVDVSYETVDGGTVATYTYSDGSTSQHLIERGRDGIDGTDGKDGQSVSAQTVYEQWLERNGLTDSTENYNAFLAALDLDLTTDNSAVVQSSLHSVATLYCEYIYLKSAGYFPSSQKQYAAAMSIGTAFIYDIEEEKNGYTYLVTNAHVVYCSKADKTANGNSYYPKNIHCFLYGSFDHNTAYGSSGQTDPTYHYVIPQYSSYAVECELVGVCLSADLAVVRAKTADLKAINPDIEEVTLADTYYAGQSVYTIGNTEAHGFSATQGIISVDNEEIALSIDSTERKYRSLRFDGFIYEGNSGGALFNARGQVVGVVNAGDATFSNMNYAIPLEIFRAVVPNLIDNFNGSSPSSATTSLLGVSVLSENTRYIYSAESGYGKIHENVIVKSVTKNSLAERMGVAENDRITALIIDSTRHEVRRSFAISDAMYCLRDGSTLQVELVRNDQAQTLQCSVTAADLNTVS